MQYLNKDNTMIMFHKIILDVNIINSIIREDYCNFKSYQNERISFCVILTRHLVINLSRCGRSTKQIDKRKVEMIPTKATTRCTYTLPYSIDDKKKINFHLAERVPLIQVW